MTDRAAIIEECARIAENACLAEGVLSDTGQMVCRVAAKRIRALAAVPPAPPSSDPWVDTRIVRFDDTIVFGKGGFDFDRWESLRWEMHTKHGSYAVWKSGDRTWSMYGTANGVLALDRYGSEATAKAEAEQYALSFQTTLVAAPPIPEREKLLEALRRGLAQIDAAIMALMKLRSRTRRPWLFDRAEDE